MHWEKTSCCHKCLRWRDGEQGHWHTVITTLLARETNRHGQGRKEPLLQKRDSLAHVCLSLFPSPISFHQWREEGESYQGAVGESASWPILRRGSLFFFLTNRNFSKDFCRIPTRMWQLVKRLKKNVFKTQANPEIQLCSCQLVNSFSFHWNKLVAYTLKQNTEKWLSPHLLLPLLFIAGLRELLRLYDWDLGQRQNCLV